MDLTALAQDTPAGGCIGFHKLDQGNGREASPCVGTPCLSAWRAGPWTSLHWPQTRQLVGVLV